MNVQKDLSSSLFCHYEIPSSHFMKIFSSAWSGVSIHLLFCTHSHQQLQEIWILLTGVQTDQKHSFREFSPSSLPLASTRVIACLLAHGQVASLHNRMSYLSCSMFIIKIRRKDVSAVKIGENDTSFFCSTLILGSHLTHSILLPTVVTIS